MMQELPARQTQSYLSNLLRSRNIWPKNKLGQNFLIDLNLMGLVIQAAELTPEDVVLEVGSGTGSLTNMLLANARSVISVEVDPNFQRLTEESVLHHPNFTLIKSDVLKGKNQIQPIVIDTIHKRLKESNTAKFKLVANLPYAVATPVISNLMIGDLVPERIVGMVQYEIAEKFISQPGSKEYGALAVLAQSLSRIEIVRKIPPSAFWPRPKVDSAIIRIQPDNQLREKLDFPTPTGITGVQVFRFFLRDLYAHRRKNLRGAILSMQNNAWTKEEVDQKLLKLNIPGNERAEVLSIEQHQSLCKEFMAEHQQIKHPD